MLWVIETLLLILVVLVPRYRKWGLVLAGVFAVVLLWAMQRSNVDVGVAPNKTTAAKTATLSAITALPLEIVQVDNLRLTGNGAPWRFTGRLINISQQYQISSANFDITRDDCYAGAGSPSGCLTVWRGKQTVAIVIPPQQARDFNIEIWLHGSALRLKGSPQDQFKLTALTGRIVNTD